MASIIYGVFKVGDAWKLYCQSDRARTFAEHHLAIAAGESAARVAASEGHQVELYLQDPTGELKRADSARWAH